jgi:hypothetical protein
MSKSDVSVIVLDRIERLLSALPEAASVK